MPSKSLPCAAKNESSSAGPSHARPKHLSLHHASSLRASAAAAIAPAQNPVRENADESGLFDSCNLRAAELLISEREALGLTLEEAAALARVSTTTIWRRENALVDLGPLKQLVRLERVKKERAGK